MSLSRLRWGIAVVGLVLVATGSRTYGAEAKDESWRGALKVGPVSLRLVFHIKERAGGALSATLDSPDQGATDIAVDKVARDKASLTFELTKLGLKYVGTLNAAGSEATGTFTQGGQSFPMTLTKGDAPAGKKPAANEQIWEGKLNIAPGIGLRLVVHIFTGKDGALTATFESPDQGAQALKIDIVTLDKTSLKFSMKSIKGEFSGKLNDDGDEAVGTWTQNARPFPLTLKKTNRVVELRRPQTPKPPFPYKTEDVNYANKAGGVTLAGTLTLPAGKGPFPAALLISGSGAQDRDETIFAHKPFAVLADTLSRRGIAVLRVDDRGVGGSTGSTSKSTSEDFAGDVLAGVEFLKARTEIDPKHIGLIGHSEGGIIAPIVAGRSQDVAFIVLMAGTGLTGEQILYLQGRLMAEAMGASKKTIEDQRTVQEKLFAVLKAEPDPKTASAKMRALAKKLNEELSDDVKKDGSPAEALPEAQLKMIESPWFRYFLTYDPVPALAKVKCPVLALNGEKDLQVPPKENLDEIENALKAVGNDHVTAKILPRLNHLFQTANNGNITEYGEIEETIAPSALQLIGDWIAAQERAK